MAGLQGKKGGGLKATTFFYCKSMIVSINGVDDMTDENEENFLVYDISDEMLEAATCIGNKKENHFTQPNGCAPLCIFAPGP